ADGGLVLSGACSTAHAFRGNSGSGKTTPPRCRDFRCPLPLGAQRGCRGWARSISSAYRLAPVASGAEEPDVLRLVTAAHRPRDHAVVLDQLVRPTRHTSSSVPLVYETLHILRNRLGQTGINFPFDALVIITFEHYEKRRY